MPRAAGQSWATHPAHSPGNGVHVQGLSVHAGKGWPTWAMGREGFREEVMLGWKEPGLGLC